MQAAQQESALRGELQQARSQVSELTRRAKAVEEAQQAAERTLAERQREVAAARGNKAVVELVATMAAMALVVLGSIWAINKFLL
jgi:hypothetical protein